MMADLKTLAHLVGGELLGNNAKFHAVSTDSRSIEFNQLFVALTGENYNGNEFMIKAQEAGAAGALVSEPNKRALIDQVVVGDTLIALQKFAMYWRKQFSIPCVGITGTNGKTTTKTMLKEILAQSHKVHFTKGNFNNDIGVSMTLLELKDMHEYSVVEMGANHRAEIGFLAKMAKPKIGIITNTSVAHLDGFKNLEGVVRTKAELFQALPSDGVAIINAESKGSLFLSKVARHCEQLNFGFSSNTDIRVSDLRVEENNHSVKQIFTLTTPDWKTQIESYLLGPHNALNAAAATAAAYALGVSQEDVVHGLQGMHPVKGRFNLHELGSGGWLIDDCYNANPASMRVAIDTSVKLNYPVWFVMGDMFEMGGSANQHHTAIGAYAKKSGVERLLAVGSETKASVEAFGEGALWFKNLESLNTHLNQIMASRADPVTVLVKASRGMQFEKVVNEVNKHFIEATGQYRKLTTQPSERI